MSFKIDHQDALIIVDVQRDFCPGGALPIPGGHQVVPVLNKYTTLFESAGAKIYATRDWHPPHHISFKSEGGNWPRHCLQKSEGAEFHPDLHLPQETEIISKATDPEEESYSGFHGTELHEMLIEKGVKRVFVGGLATDYCVKHTVLDALELGFETVLLVDAIRGVDHRESRKAVQEMVREGTQKAKLIDLE